VTATRQLSLFKSVVVTLTYLRRNHVQQELAEYYGVSQSTISRAITAITPELARVMRPFTPTAQELPSDEQLIVDGTLVSCWSWDDHPELYSGKHHTTGLTSKLSATWPVGCAGSPTPLRAAATTVRRCAARACRQPRHEAAKHP
jgi:Helix-turn-helix of DDE superfamily endonuclease